MKLTTLDTELTHSKKRAAAAAHKRGRKTRPLTTNCNDPLSGIWRETALRRYLSSIFPKDVVHVDYVTDIQRRSVKK
jgi:hypothetical protein